MLSPRKRKTIIMPAATILAFSLWMCPTLFRREIIRGMLPMISITANRIMVADRISLKLKFMRS